MSSIKKRGVPFIFLAKTAGLWCPPLALALLLAGAPLVAAPMGAAAPMPYELLGLWQAAGRRQSIPIDRYVLFDGDASAASGDAASGQFSICVVLRLYDSWYDDRAAEPLSYKEAWQRDRNSASSSEAEHITAFAQQIAPAVWEINARYGKRADDKTIIPVAVIGDNLYLDFAYKTGEMPFYQGVRSQNVIRSCPMPSSLEHTRPQSKEIACYYAAPEAVYQIRYWPVALTASEKNNIMVSFSVGEKAGDTKEYKVPAQIVSLGGVFTCVTGRSKKVRRGNVISMPADFFEGKRSADGMVAALGAPAMVRKDEHRLQGGGRIQGNVSADSAANARQEMFDMVKSDNSRRAPPPKPLLPPSSADWNMDTINALEEGNEIIRGVRERSRDFTATGGSSAKADVESAMKDNSRLKPDWRE